MRSSGHPRHGSQAHGLIGSLCLHLGLLCALIWLPTIEQLKPALEDSIEVELVTPQQAEPVAEPRQPEPVIEAAKPANAAVKPAPSEIAASAPLTPTQPRPVSPPVIAAPVMIRARRTLSSKILAEPGSRQAREALTQLDPSERIEQLCNLEAMSQIQAWKADFQPDRVVAYAMSETRLSAGMLQADGAAFRSKRQWYRLRFRCETTPDRTKVAGFEFLVGDAVPRSEWAAHDLPTTH